jgi:hypothetical protein
MPDYFLDFVWRLPSALRCSIKSVSISVDKLLLLAFAAFSPAVLTDGRMELASLIRQFAADLPKRKIE